MQIKEGIKTDGGGQPKTQILAPSLKQGLSTTFNIPYRGQTFAQYVEGKVTLTLKGGKKIERNIARTGTDEFEVILGVTDDDGAYAETSDYITIERSSPQV